MKNQSMLNKWKTYANSSGERINVDEDESPFPGLNDSECETTDWSDWSECSSSCGIGSKTRRRKLRKLENRKKCYYVSLMEKEKCMQPACIPGVGDQQDDICKVRVAIFFRYEKWLKRKINSWVKIVMYSKMK